MTTPAISIESLRVQYGKFVAVDGLSPEQRFFLSYAQGWRSTMRPEQERLFLQTDGHSPPRYRVRGPLENMPVFATAFACDASRTLRPESERASIW